MYKHSPQTQKLLLAFIGMPGAGKSIVSEYLKQRKYPVVRFGDLTEKKLRELSLERNPKNEEMIRESLRKEFGMDAYAIQARSKISDFFKENNTVVIDGLYSWEEYLFLKRNFSNLFLIHIYAEPIKRYTRLSKRTIRPFTLEEAKIRDVAEIEHLSKGGPIAMADYLIDNDGNIESLFKKIDTLLRRMSKA